MGNHSKVASSTEWRLGEIVVNMCKRAAVWKESLTLDKNKEDQSKYYLSYPNPPVLDMRWERA